MHGAPALVGADREAMDARVLAALHEAAWMLDDDLVVVAENGSAESLAGGAVGRSVGLLPVGALARRTLLDACCGARSGDAVELELTLELPEGPVHVLLDAAPLGPGGGVLLRLRDITGRVARRRDALAERDRSRAIVNCMHDGYGLTCDGELLEVNDALCAMTGFPREQLVGTRVPFPFWPPELHAEMLALRTRIHDVQGGTHEVTFLRADGSRFPVETSTTAVRDASGAVIGYLNTVRDITERKQLERAREEHTESVEVLAAITREIAHAAPADGPQAVCDRARRATGASVAGIWTAQEDGVLRLLAFSGHVAPSIELGPEHDHLAVRQCWLTGQDRFVPDSAGPEVDARLRQHAGSASVHYSPIHGRDGTVGVLALSWDAPLLRVGEALRERIELLAHESAIALSRAQAEASLQQEARSDPLTGLANRRAFQERLAGQLAHTRRTGATASLVLLDLDRFKAFNDLHGHGRGDELLTEASARWSSRLRGSDLLARWGGEEFCLLLPDCGHQAAERLVDELRALTPDGQTFSAGIMPLEAGSSAEQALRDADRALYAAKDAGRARTITVRL